MDCLILPHAYPPVCKCVAMQPQKARSTGKKWTNEAAMAYSLVWIVQKRRGVFQHVIYKCW